MAHLLKSAYEVARDENIARPAFRTARSTKHCRIEDLKFEKAWFPRFHRPLFLLRSSNRRNKAFLASLGLGKAKDALAATQQAARPR